MDDIKRPIIVSRSNSAKPKSSLTQAATPKNSPFPKPPKPRRHILRIIIAIIVLVIIGLGGFVVARAFKVTSKIFVGQNSSFYKTLGSVLSSQTGNVHLQGEEQGQINLLLLGIGGQGHDGPFLSDTMILVQIRPGDKKASMVSIPRDYFINLGDGEWRKINSAFSEGYAKRNNWNDGGEKSRQAVGQLTGLHIPYFAVLDFQGFQKAIDLIGGVDVTIDHTFTDYTFPNDATNGYLAPVTFTQGAEHMNGKRALIFARSRHAAGPEGSDFARSSRQHKIITATKTKVIDLNLITDAGKINNLFSVIGDHVHTNLSPGEMLHLYSLTKDFSHDQIISSSLDTDTKLVCNGTDAPTGAFILQPCDGVTSTDIKNFFSDSFTTNKLSQEKSIIWLADSTLGKTLYKSAATILQKQGFSVLQISYKGSPLNQNIAYSVNSKPATMEFLKSNLQASAVTLPPPGILIDKNKVDIIVILGE